MNYTKEQLIQISNNIRLVSINAIQVLKVISQEQDINHSDIHAKAGLSKFITDKCIAAFLAAGLIKRVDDGIKRFFYVTAEGTKLLNLEEEMSCKSN